MAPDDPGGAGHRGQPRHRRELARQLALRSDTVVLTARDLAKAEQAAATLPDHERVLARRLDVTDPASIAQVAADLDRRFGRLDVLVNNAASHYDADLAATKAAGASANSRCLDTDKAWDAIGYLLRRVGFPVDVVHGEHPITGAEDWGYGPPRYLTAGQVTVAAKALASTTFEQLTNAVALEELARADVYPQLDWEREESLNYLREHYEALGGFYQAAARAGDAMLVWLD